MHIICFNDKIRKWITVFTQRIQTPYSLPFESVPFTACRCVLKTAGGDNVNPCQMPRSAAPHLSLHCLLRSVCPKTLDKESIVSTL